MKVTSLRIKVINKLALKQDLKEIIKDDYGGQSIIVWHSVN